MLWTGAPIIEPFSFYGCGFESSCLLTFIQIWWSWIRPVKRPCPSEQRNTYRISSYSFRGNSSFLNLTFGHSTYRCGDYSREETICGNMVCKIYTYVLLNFYIICLDEGYIFLQLILHDICWSKIIQVFRNKFHKEIAVFLGLKGSITLLYIKWIAIHLVSTNEINSEILYHW